MLEIYANSYKNYVVVFCSKYKNRTIFSSTMNALSKTYHLHKKIFAQKLFRVANTATYVSGIYSLI